MAQLQTTIVSSNTQVSIPSGTTAQRPGSPTNGEIRFNTDLGYLETYYNSNWIRVENNQRLRDRSCIDYLFTMPGFYRITVTSEMSGRNFCAVAVGGGGGGGSTDNTDWGSGSGGGGALAYINQVSVNTGDVIFIRVGNGGDSGAPGAARGGSSGGPSFVQLNGTTIINANGGAGGGAGGQGQIPAGAASGGSFTANASFGTSRGGGNGGNGGGNWNGGAAGAGAGGFGGSGGTSAQVGSTLQGGIEPTALHAGAAGGRQYNRPDLGLGGHGGYSTDSDAGAGGGGAYIWAYHGVYPTGRDGEVPPFGDGAGQATRNRGGGPGGFPGGGAGGSYDENGVQGGGEGADGAVRITFMPGLETFPDYLGMEVQDIRLLHINETATRLPDDY